MEKVVYVTDQTTDSVWVFGPQNNQRKILPLPPKPCGIAVTPDNRHAYVLHFKARVVSVISTASNDFVLAIPVEFGWPVGIAVGQTKNGGRAYVTYHTKIGGGGVMVIDTASHKMLAKVKVMKQPGAVAFTPDAQIAFVANWGGHTVSVIDTATNQVIKTIGGGNFAWPYGIACSSDGTLAYVAVDTGNWNFNWVAAVIDVGKLQLIPEIEWPEFPDTAWQVSTEPNNRPYAWFTLPDGDAVSVVSTQTNTELVNIAFEAKDSPMGIAIAPDGRHCYVACGSKHLVRVVDVMSHKILGALEMGAGSMPCRIAILQK